MRNRNRHLLLVVPNYDIQYRLLQDDPRLFWTDIPHTEWLHHLLLSCLPLTTEGLNEVPGSNPSNFPPFSRLPFLWLHVFKLDVIQLVVPGMEDVLLLRSSHSVNVDGFHLWHLEEIDGVEGGQLEVLGEGGKLFLKHHLLVLNVLLYWIRLRCQFPFPPPLDLNLLGLHGIVLQRLLSTDAINRLDTEHLLQQVDGRGLEPRGCDSLCLEAELCFLVQLDDVLVPPCREQRPAS